MVHRLYCLRDPDLDRGLDQGDRGGDRFGIGPFTAEHHQLDAGPTKTIGLRKDLGWKEVSHLQRVLRAADMWDGFPERDLTLVSAEVRLERGAHRLDLLYLRRDGGLLPCELKIGGRSRETHRQLLRYTAKLEAEPIDLDWVRRQRRSFLDRVRDDGAETLHEERFEQFLIECRITDVSLHVVRNTGIIIDERAPGTLRAAVRSLNRDRAFAIRLIEMRCLVDTDWRPDAPEFSFVLDFVEIDCDISLSTNPN